MANSWYNKGRQAFATAGVNWPSDTIKVSAVDSADYTPNLTAHQFYSSVTAGGIVSVATLAGKTATDGVLDADDTTLPLVSGDQFELLVIWKDTGSSATSPLLLCIDTTTTGLPLTPNGSDVLVTWNASGIARL